MTAFVCAVSRHDLEALIKVRKRLEAGFTAVDVWFTDGSSRVTFTSRDLPNIRQKIIFSM